MADGVDILSLLRSNPALVQAALSALSGAGGESAPGASSAVQAARAPLSEEKRTPQASRRRALMEGLRAYLGEERGKTLDAALLFVGALENFTDFKKGANE